MMQRLSFLYLALVPFLSLFPHNDDPLNTMPAEQWLPRTVAIAPVVYALTRGAQYLKQEVVSFIPTNPIQERFVESYLPEGVSLKEIKKRMALHKFADKELQVWVSDTVAQINAQLEKHGYDIRLDELPSPSFYLASVMDIQVSWRKKGFATKLRSGNYFYPAVSMGAHVMTCEAAGHEHPVFGVLTTGSDIVYMTKADKELSNFALLSRVMQIEEGLRVKDTGYDELIFPMVELNEKNDISWLISLGFDRKREILQAKQQNKFAMNEKGARAQSAAAISVAKALSAQISQPKIYLMDEPFFCWISRPGVPYPIFAGYLNQEVWRRPASVSDEVSEEPTKSIPLSVGVL